MNEIRYISVDVYRGAKNGDCTNRGISSRFDELLVACPDGPWSFDADAGIPINFCIMEKRAFGYGTVYGLIPATVDQFGTVRKRDGRWYSFGGNFGYCSDCRFNDMHPGMIGAVAIYDRWEGRGH